MHFQQDQKQTKQILFNEDDEDINPNELLEGLSYIIAKDSKSQRRKNEQSLCCL